MRAHCFSESPSPSRLFSTTAQNVRTSRAAPVTQDHLPIYSILFKVSPITSSGDAVGRSGDYRMPIRSGSITICRMIGRPFSTTREACRDLRFSRICQIGCQRFSRCCPPLKHDRQAVQHYYLRNDRQAVHQYTRSKTSRG